MTESTATRFSLTDRSAEALAGLRRQRRRLVVNLWRHIPEPMQRLAIRLMMPKVTLGVCAVIQDARGRVLLVHHTYRNQPWDLPGGFLRAHEQPATALARELREELGVQTMVGPLLASSLTGSHLTQYYRATIANRPMADNLEIDGFRFVAPNAIPELMGGTPNWLIWTQASRPQATDEDTVRTIAGD